MGQQGAICLDTLGSGWSPVGTIKMALLSLRMLLESPNPKDPQDAEVAKMMMEDPEYFSIVAHDWAVKYAGAPRREPPPGQYKRKKVEKQPDDPTRYVRQAGRVTTSTLASAKLHCTGTRDTARISFTALSIWASSWTP